MKLTIILALLTLSLGVFAEETNVADTTTGQCDDKGNTGARDAGKPLPTAGGAEAPATGAGGTANQ